MNQIISSPSHTHFAGETRFMGDVSCLFVFFFYYIPFLFLFLHISLLKVHSICMLP